MLILTRRIDETVMIWDTVSITVLGIKGNQVRLGIDAPASVPVHRWEIWERIKKEQQENGGAQPEALEISLIRPPGRGEVHLRTSSEHPGMLVVIGLEGLPHGGLIGLDADNRARLRRWLDAQDANTVTGPQ